MFARLFDRISTLESQLVNRFNTICKGLDYDLSEILSTAAIKANSRFGGRLGFAGIGDRTPTNIGMCNLIVLNHEGFVFPVSGSYISLSHLFPSVKDWSILCLI